MSNEILKGTTLISLLTLVSRLLGFIWNLVFAKLFGAGLLADCFFVAFKIPNLLRSILGEGALSAAFIPVFSAELEKNRQQAERTLKSVSGLLLIASILITILGVIFTPLIIDFIAPGYLEDPERYQLCITLTQITLPYIIFVSLIALISGALNSVKKYGAAPLSQIVMNIVLIITCYLVSFWEPETGIKLLSIGVLVGGFAQIIIQLPALKAAKLSIFPNVKLLNPSSKKVLFLMIPACFGAAIYQISIFINTMLATLLPTGSVSWLFYADRLSQLPIGVLTIAIMSVLLPELSKSQANNNSLGFQHNMNNSLRYISFLIIPSSAGLIILAEPLIQLLFERGEFTSFDTFQTAGALQATAFGLWGISCSSIVSRGFLAKQDTLTPSLLGIFTLLLNVLLALLLMGKMDFQADLFLLNVIADIQNYLIIIFPHLDYFHVGLALASGLALTFTLVISMFVLDRRLENWSFQPFLKASFTSLLASLVMMLAIYYLKTLISNNLILIIAACPVAFISYGIAYHIFGGQEIRELTKLIRRKTKI